MYFSLFSHLPIFIQKQVNHESGGEQHNHHSHGMPNGLAPTRQHSQSNLDDADHRENKRQPMMKPMVEPTMSGLRALRLMRARKASSTSLLLSRFSASFSLCATSDDKRKKLNDTTLKTRSFLATSTPTSQKEWFSRLCLARGGEGEAHEDDNREKGVHVH